MADWSVKIAVVNGKTVFQTQLQSGNSSTTYMSTGDTVSWNNQTKETLQPTLTLAGKTVFQTDPIPPDYSSTPAWVAPKPPQTYAVTAALCDGSTVSGSIIVS